MFVCADSSTSYGIRQGQSWNEEEAGKQPVAPEKAQPKISSALALRGHLHRPIQEWPGRIKLSKACRQGTAPRPDWSESAVTNPANLSDKCRRFFQLMLRIGPVPGNWLAPSAPLPG